MNQQQLNDLTTRCHEAAKANGWHEQLRSQNEFILLIQSEMFECFEAYRKNKHAKNDFKKFDDAQLFFESGKFDKEVFNVYIKDTFEDELADTAIRIFDFAGKCGFTLSTTIYSSKAKTFIDCHKDFVKISANGLDNEFVEDYFLSRLLDFVEQIAILSDIDLLRHIDLKLEYNKTRGIRHGNKIL